MKPQEREEVIELLKTVIYTFDWINFEDNLRESRTHSFELQSKNFWVDLEVEVTVKFESNDFYEIDDIKLIDFKVSDRCDEILVDADTLEQHFTEDEIIDNLNIFV